MATLNNVYGGLNSAGITAYSNPFAPGVSSSAPVSPLVPVAPSAPVKSSTPIFSGTKKSATPVAPNAPGLVPGFDYSKYKDPVTGKIMSPQEYADYIASKVPKGNGDISNYAGNSKLNPNQTTDQLNSTMTNLNNTRNDIATGTTDPYKIGNESGINYTPDELNAIQKAFSGIYDPALNDVNNRLQDKQKQDQAALDEKTKLSEMAQQHQYDMELKRTPTYSDSNGNTSSNSGPYIPGADPIVDGWIQSINSGKAKLSDLSGNKNINLKNQVALGLAGTKSSSDDMLTTSVQSLKDLNDMVTNNQGFSGAVGAKGLSSLFGLRSEPFQGTPAADFNAKLSQVKNDVILPNLTMLHGLGRVTDREFQALTSAVTSLSTKTSETAFKSELANVTKMINEKLKESPTASAPTSSNSNNSNSPAKGEDGASYGFPGYVSDGTQWIKQ